MNALKPNRFRALVLVGVVCFLAGATGVAVASAVTQLSTEKAKAGKVIDTTSGRAVYLFSRDSRTQSKCTGKCASSWPPVTGKAAAASGSGLNAKLLGTIKRGSQTQVTYNHHPLYFFSGDKAHTTKGEGASAFSGHWYLVSPAGGAVKPKKTAYCKTVCQGY